MKLLIGLEFSLFFPIFNFAFPLPRFHSLFPFPDSILRFHFPFSVSVTPDFGWIDDSYAAYALACVASVSVRFRSKERPRNWIFGLNRARNKTCAICRAVFDSRSSFFVPKPHRNACYAGYIRVLPSHFLSGTVIVF